MREGEGPMFRSNAMRESERSRSAHPTDDVNSFSVQTAPVLDQTHEIYNGAVNPWMGYKYAQVFTPAKSGLLCRVELNLEVPDAISAARVSIIKVIRGMPGNNPEDVLGRSDLATPLQRGWNEFQISDRVAVCAGEQYAIVLEPLTVCDWRVNWTRSACYTGAFYEQVGDDGWEVVWPGCATYRTYVRTMESAPSQPHAESAPDEPRGW